MLQNLHVMGSIIKDVEAEAAVVVVVGNKPNSCDVSISEPPVMTFVNALTMTNNSCSEVSRGGGSGGGGWWLVEAVPG